MRFVIKGKKYEVDFRHAFVDLVFSPELPIITRRTTWAKLFIIEEDGNKFDTALYAIAECSELDTYNKETGRKIALSRLIKQMNLTKKEREYIWAVYFNRGTDFIPLHLDTFEMFMLRDEEFGKDWWKRSDL